MLERGSHAYLVVCPVKIQAGGIYVIKDLQTSYLTQFGGGSASRNDTMAASIKALLDYLMSQGLASGPEELLIINPLDLLSVDCFEQVCVLVKKD